MATIYGTTGADTRNGTAGNDTIFGWARSGNASSPSGNDTLDGGAGNDSILGGTGNDDLYGGLGLDTLRGGAGNDNIKGDNGNDKLYGEAGNDTLGGGRGSDTLNGGAGNDILYGGSDDAGSDYLSGSTGNDKLYGGAGSDNLNGGAGIDTLIGGTGDDFYRVDSTGDTIIELSNQGFDRVESSISYTLGNNVEELNLIGTDAINGTGNSSNNLIFGNSANNVLEGKAGNDYLMGSFLGNDTLIGGTGDDYYSIRTFSLIGDETIPDTVIEGLNAGIDTVELDGFNNYTLVDNLENLTISSLSSLGSNSSNFRGNTLDNVIFHSYGFDLDSPMNGYAFGDAGNDSLYGGGYLNLDGGTGNDTLFAGFFYDTLTGGIGADNFSFGSPSFSDIFEGTHTITDFVVADDTITVNSNSSIFNGGLTAGAAITADQFRIGSAAADASDRFIYNKSTGALFFDSDGTGTASQVQFVQLSSGLAMTNNDIFVTG